MMGKKEKKRVALGMSGGVDSSTAAKLLQDQGYEVVGFFMKLWHDSGCDISRENACCDEKSLMDARKVADILGIKFYVLDAREEFKKSVVDYFIDEYKNLRTPNPCVVCNEKIKFGWLLNYAVKLDCDYLATGHYARISQSEDGRFHLLKGKDEAKDQTYFLHRLNQAQLARVLFPMGEYTKPEVRAMAKKWGLPVHEKVESQEICFIQNGTYREFLQRYLPKDCFKKGEIIDGQGNLIGYHDGLINYTIGQRKGINQTQKIKGKTQNRNSELKTDKKPMYVTGFEVKNNSLVVGSQDALLKKGCLLRNIHWINSDLQDQITELPDLKAKIRYRAKEVKCKASMNGDQLLIAFDQPQRAVTPGQSAVLYCGDEVIGGGVIS